MAFLTSDSAIRVDRDLERQLATASHSEIMQALHQAAEHQMLVARDPFSGDLHATPLADNAPRKFTRTLTVDGVRYTLEADSPEELNEGEIQFHRDLQAQQQQPTEQARDAQGRFVADEDPAIAEQVEVYLRRRGIDPEFLSAASGKGYQHSWEQATEQFRQRHPEYQGGDANVQRFGDALIELGLDDSPSVESLERAYAELQRTNGIAENPEIAFEREISGATSVEDIRNLSYRAAGLPPSSGVWGGR